MDWRRPSPAELLLKWGLWFENYGKSFYIPTLKSVNKVTENSVPLVIAPPHFFTFQGMAPKAIELPTIELQGEYMANRYTLYHTILGRWRWTSELSYWYPILYILEPSTDIILLHFMGSDLHVPRNISVWIEFLYDINGKVVQAMGWVFCALKEAVIVRFFNWSRISSIQHSLHSRSIVWTLFAHTLLSLMTVVGL